MNEPIENTESIPSEEAAGQQDGRALTPEDCVQICEGLRSADPHERQAAMDHLFPIEDRDIGAYLIRLTTGGPVHASTSTAEAMHAFGAFAERCQLIGRAIGLDLQWVHAAPDPNALVDPTGREFRA